LLAKQQKLQKVSKGLVLDSATRFSSKHSMIVSLIANKHTLRSTVVRRVPFARAQVILAYQSFACKNGKKECILQNVQELVPELCLNL
jgi:hypothetical protein